MIATSESFLRHMGWNEHQAVLIAHEDKSYKHVHIMLNVVHPETGLRLNDGFGQRRAQAWALEYEREQGRIHCEQRQMNAGDRRKEYAAQHLDGISGQRKGIFAHRKNNGRKFDGNSRKSQNAEWRILKEFQRDERMEFFAQGKSEFSALRNSIYREVREEFRERWADFYEMRRNGADAESLATARAQLVADQKAVLEPRRDEACKELRETRDIRYRELLDHQKDMRAELRWRQDAGLDAAPFLNELEERKQAGQEIRTEFREAGRELVTRDPGANFEANTRDADEYYDAPVNSGHDANINIGGRIGHGFMAFADALFTDLTNLGSAPPKPMSAEDRADMFREATENTLKQHQQLVREEEDESWRQRQRVHGE
jgi:hypothetical protein